MRRGRTSEKRKFFETREAYNEYTTNDTENTCRK